MLCYNIAVAKKPQHAPVDHYLAICYTSIIVSKQEPAVSNWIKDGQAVVARYMGQTVQGTVESSRVKYGGSVQYTVVLSQPVKLRWRTEPTDRVLIDQSELLG